MNNPFQELYEKLESIESKIVSMASGDNPMAGLPQIVTTEQLCKLLGVNAGTILNKRKKKQIPFMQIGTAIRYDFKAVLKALENKPKQK